MKRKSNWINKDEKEEDSEYFTGAEFRAIRFYRNDAGQNKGDQQDRGSLYKNNNAATRNPGDQREELRRLTREAYQTLEANAKNIPLPKKMQKIRDRILLKNEFSKS